MLCLGAETLTNAKLASLFGTRSTDEILRRTGIASRPRLGHHESAVSLAVTAAKKVLKRESLSLLDIDSIICSSTTPASITPSTACLVLHELSQSEGRCEIPAFDLSAACTGFLYALAAGHDFLQSHPDSIVLVITAEAMSKVVDPTDFDTAVLFGDAASATVLYGPNRSQSAWALSRRPVISASGEDGRILRIGANDNSKLHMDGKRVFQEAVRRMTEMLSQACARDGVDQGDIDLIVPHQANGRIIEAIRHRLGLSPERVLNNVRDSGNTSSTSIPLCLSSLAIEGRLNRRVGLTAFGGGFTFGAAILEANPHSA